MPQQVPAGRSYLCRRAERATGISLAPGIAPRTADAGAHGAESSLLPLSWISLGSDAGELIAARGRSVPLAPRIRVAPPASVPPLVRAAPPLGAAAESRSAKTSRGCSLQPRKTNHLRALCQCKLASWWPLSAVW